MDSGVTWRALSLLPRPPSASAARDVWHLGLAPLLCSAAIAMHASALLSSSSAASVSATRV